jgi:transcriptional regulator with XRE-family HTH domain
MNADPLSRIPVVFGNLLRRLRVERTLAPDAFALAASLSGADDVARMERGEREPTLTELFRIANALGEPPTVLFVDVFAEWRTDPTDYRLYNSRASDFERLYRLGYHENPGDFREMQRTYGTVDAATADARKLNAARRKKERKTLDTICIYIRMGSIGFKWRPEGEPDAREVAP